jgi:hypothetical protein
MNLSSDKTNEESKNFYDYLYNEFISCGRFNNCKLIEKTFDKIIFIFTSLV